MTVHSTQIPPKQWERLKKNMLWSVKYRLVHVHRSDKECPTSMSNTPHCVENWTLNIVLNIVLNTPHCVELPAKWEEEAPKGWWSYKWCVTPQRQPSRCWNVQTQCSFTLTGTLIVYICQDLIDSVKNRCSSQAKFIWEYPTCACYNVILLHDEHTWHTNQGCWGRWRCRSVFTGRKDQQWMEAMEGGICSSRVTPRSASVMPSKGNHGLGSWLSRIEFTKTTTKTITNTSSNTSLNTSSNTSSKTSLNTSINTSTHTCAK